jgi:hypothetical protein
VGRASRSDEGPLASPWYWLVQSVTGEPLRHLEHQISLHKAASEVRYIAIFNNGSPTEPNGVSELSLGATQGHSVYY